MRSHLEAQPSALGAGHAHRVGSASSNGVKGWLHPLGGGVESREARENLAQKDLGIYNLSVLAIPLGRLPLSL
jgi:hypothetical protein